MVDFCSQNQIPMRGHCIFWECEHNIQDWLKTVTPTELADALQHRAVDLLSRYRGKFRHYDVNNEMLHGCFYRDRLNPEILPYMFKLAHQFDPEAVLFVNDYHVCDGEDANSAADKYAEQVKWLLREGAPVGGIGVQGHVDTPIGPIVCNSLDKLSSVGIPIWMTEIDVAAENEHIRADDLEVLTAHVYISTNNQQTKMDIMLVVTCTCVHREHILEGIGCVGLVIDFKELIGSILCYVVLCTQLY
jgi:GH35 family endo-1,4-beta-xylanase